MGEEKLRGKARNGGKGEKGRLRITREDKQRQGEVRLGETKQRNASSER